MKLGYHAGIIALASGLAGTALAQGSTSLDVIGNIKGTFDGESREWVTLAGQIGGQAGSSANWQRMAFEAPDLAASLGAMAESLPPEQRAQLEAMSKQLGESNPMLEMFSQMAGVSVGDDNFTVSISGHDPDSPNIMTEQVMVLSAELFGKDLPIGKPVPADVTYVSEASEKGFMPRIMYMAADDNEPTITFDRLELEPDGGHATGSFRATLCPLNMEKLMEGPDLSKCVDTEGTFDTALTEEEPMTL